MNSINIIGRVGQDPETRNANNGTAIAKFTLAVDRGRKDAKGNKQVDWFTIKAFGKTAEVVAQYVQKGRQVAVTGAHQNEKYEANDGTEKDYWVVNAERVTLLGDRAESQAQPSRSGEAQRDARPSGGYGNRNAPRDNGIPF